MIDLDKENLLRKKEEDKILDKAYSNEVGCILETLAFLSVIIILLLLYLVSKQIIGREFSSIISGFICILATSSTLDAKIQHSFNKNFDFEKMRCKVKFNQYTYAIICVLSGLLVGIWDFLYTF